jgi:hypothetical protein
MEKLLSTSQIDKTALKKPRKNSESQKNLPFALRSCLSSGSLKIRKASLPKLKSKEKFEYHDFSFVPTDKNEDLHSHSPTAVLDILSGNKPPDFYRKKFYEKYLQSLSQNSFGHIDTLSKEFIVPNKTRNEIEQLSYLKRKYAKCLPKIKRKPIMEIKRRGKIKKKREEKGEILIAQADKEKELRIEIKQFELKLIKLSGLPKLKQSTSDIYYTDIHIF